MHNKCVSKLLYAQYVGVVIEVMQEYFHKDYEICCDKLYLLIMRNLGVSLGGGVM